MLDNKPEFGININLPDKIADDLHPAVKQVARTVSIIFGSVNTLLIPLEITSALANHKAENFIRKITQTASRIPKERLDNPNIAIIGPALEGAKYSFTNDDLRDMYANLIAKSLDKAEAGNQFLSFVHIINQLSPAEARLFKSLFKNDSFMSYPIARINYINEQGFIVAMDCLSNYQFEELSEKQIANMIQNLGRLGLIDIDHEVHISSDPNAYDYVENSESIENIRKYAPSGFDVGFNKALFRLSLFGKSFYITCIFDDIA